MQRWLGVVAGTMILSACDQPAGLLDADTAFAPYGDVTNQASVDGLLVGHRLMENGEYELALRAYYRAAGRLGTNADVLSALGSANLKLGRLGQAEDLLRKAVKQDQSSVPAWNNLGVVLMNTGQVGEASRVFRNAFALDSGNSDEIRENLRRALAILDNSAYNQEQNNQAFDLVRRGQGNYLLLKTP
ncbi:MAG: tetratricopeptide repeat protein [Pseudomonadota bacterium]